LQTEVFANNQLKDEDLVSQKLTALMESNGISDKRAAIAIPGPSVFTKKIKMTKASPAELAVNVQFEAGSFIPHNIDAVKLDFHIVGESGKDQLDILVVAAKSEVIDSFTECLALAGIDTAVVDVDYFAVQNCFELGYPEMLSKTVALINMGARYSSITICRDGESLFSGDISLAGKLFTEAIMQELGCDAETAERLKVNPSSSENAQAIQDALERKVEYVATEFNRQLSLFWNATGEAGGVDKILITGGGALVPGLCEEIQEKTDIECEMLDPLRAVEFDDGFDVSYLKQVAPFMAVALGLGVREPGDKEIPA
jgi:type IV pilus assembly protein PilM